MLNKPGIYQIASTIKPDRIYIGSAVNLRKRINNHSFDLVHQRHGNSKLQNHCNKYGIEDLVFTIIILCSPSQLIEYEQIFIDRRKPWFNIRKIADSNLGIVYSEEYCRKLSETRKGREPWNKGLRGVYKHSEETREKMRKNAGRPNLGKHPSLETRRLMSQKMKGRKGTWTGKKRGPQPREVVERRVAATRATLAKNGKKTIPEELRQRLREASLLNGSKPPSRKGCHVSDETKLKLKMAMTGRVMTKEHKNKISEAQRGKKLSEEHKKKLSEAKKGNKNRLGKKFSEESRRRMSEAHKKKVA